MTLVIGHGGASTVAPANTLRSFDAAVDAGADMIEFDVRPRGGELVLAHGARAMLRGGCLALDEALDHLGRPDRPGVGRLGPARPGSANPTRVA
jgi:glycerophosphoryl diester phosphodiesterase